ncbi:MAG: hypothetical protein QNJ55_31725 [Xenococcus sp. MO_188.B8]|nr:hypothetical protein [Xenococcus sp. MO_188.B8]
MTQDSQFNSIDNQKSTETNKIIENNFLSKLIKVIKLISPWLWGVIILFVIMPIFGNTIIQNSLKPKVETPTTVNQPVVIERKQYEIDNAIASAIKDARKVSAQKASEDLERWISELMIRVDDDFLPWYFDYFHQKGRELNTVWTGLSSAALHRIDTNRPPAKQAIAAKLTQDFQLEFANRVLRPQIAQLELERIAQNTVNLYADRIVQNLGNVKASYQIPQGDWERYINDIAITVFGTEGNPTGKIQRDIVIGTTGFILAKAMLPTIGKISSKVVVSLASKTGAKMAAKTGTLVAGKLGVQLIDPIAAIGIIAWDVWDHHHTVNVEKPVLRKALYDYLEQVKFSLLDNHQNSIMSSIYQVEDQILESLSNSNTNS